MRGRQALNRKEYCVTKLLGFIVEGKLRVTNIRRLQDYSVVTCLKTVIRRIRGYNPSFSGFLSGKSKYKPTVDYYKLTVDHREDFFFGAGKEAYFHRGSINGVMPHNLPPVQRIRDMNGAVLIVFLTSKKKQPYLR